MIIPKINKKILLIFPAFPFPLRANGLAMRYYPLLRYLNERYHIDIIINCRYLENEEVFNMGEDLCNNIFIVKQPIVKKVKLIERIKTKIRFIMPHELPRSWITYGWKDIARQITGSCKDNIYDAVICVSGYSYPYIKYIKARKKVIDFIDSPSLLASRNVIGSNRFNIIRKYEEWKTRRWEKRILHEFDSVIYISKYDAEFIPHRKVKLKPYVIPNGLSYDNHRGYIENKVCSPNIGFFGNMSYYPNIEATLWLYNNVFTVLRNEIRDLSFYIIGKSPSENIKKLNEIDGVYVTGEVENIWSYINVIDVFVFPLLRGAGLKNKILEAMYAKKPVVTTNIGNEGIDAVSGRDIYVCQTPEEYCKVVFNMIKNPEERSRIGEAGHSYVVNNYSWPQILHKYDKCIFE